jgi:hypothetical protein
MNPNPKKNLKQAKVASPKKAAAAGSKKANAARRADTPDILVVTLGSVSVQVNRPSDKERAKRVAESKAVATGIRKAVAKPGVRLAMKRTTPVYTVDAKDPQLVLRKIGSTSVRGRFEKGQFVKVSA